MNECVQLENWTLIIAGVAISTPTAFINSTLLIVSTAAAIAIRIHKIPTSVAVLAAAASTVVAAAAAATIIAMGRAAAIINITIVAVTENPKKQQNPLLEC